MSRRVGKQVSVERSDNMLRHLAAVYRSCAHPSVKPYIGDSLSQFASASIVSRARHPNDPWANGRLIHTRTSMQPVILWILCRLLGRCNPLNRVTFGLGCQNETSPTCGHLHPQISIGFGVEVGWLPALTNSPIPVQIGARLC